jgi:hypothetical protein
MSIVARAKAALRERFTSLFPITVDHQGYTSCPQANLLPGISLADFEKELRCGDGGELKKKFCAVHSSAALAVNCFAPFNTRPADIMLCGKRGAESVEFEKHLPIFRGGTPPNMDVWIDRGSGAVAVESKLLEYLTLKLPAFAKTYERLARNAEPCWWAVYEQAKEGAAQHLDRAQLVKHYFGLSAYRKRHPDRQLSLLYLFWEPLNWDEVAECRRHRGELEACAGAVSASCIDFRWTTYSQLWEEWSTVPALAHHAQRLKARYEVRV